MDFASVQPIVEPPTFLDADAGNLHAQLPTMLVATDCDGSQPTLTICLLWWHALCSILWELAHTLIWQICFVPAPPAPLITGGFILVWILVGANIASLALPKTHQRLADQLLTRQRLAEHGCSERPECARRHGA